MLINNLSLALALSATVSAAALQLRSDDPCRDAFDACTAAKRPEAACSCIFASCAGESNARTADFCASATAGLPSQTPTPTPSPYIIPAPAATPAPPADHPAPPAPAPAPPAPAPAPPAPAPAPHAPAPAPAPPAPAPAPPAAPPAGFNPILVPGEHWTVANLTRFCGPPNAECNFNFVLEANGKTERCTIIRRPGANAVFEEWGNEPCTDGSDTKVAWGIGLTPAPAYAILTITQGHELAWFGVPNINVKDVTPHDPYGSGDYGTFDAPVYTYQ